MVFSAELDLVAVGKIVARKFKCGLISQRHRNIFRRIAAVAEKYEHVFNEDTRVQIMSPDYLTEAEIRSALYANDNSIVEAAISTLGVKYSPCINACRDILRGRFFKAGDSIPFEPSDPPICCEPGKGKLITSIDSGSSESSTSPPLRSKTNTSLPAPFRRDNVNRIVVVVQGSDTVTAIGIDELTSKQQFLLEQLAAAVKDKGSRSKILDIKADSRISLPKLSGSGLGLVDIGYRHVQTSGPGTSDDDKLGFLRASPRDVVVFLTAKAQQRLIRKSTEWEKDLSRNFRGPLLWLDTRIKRVQIEEGGRIYHLKSIDSNPIRNEEISSNSSDSNLGVMDVDKLYTHMLMNSNETWPLFMKLRKYLDKHRNSGEDNETITLHGLNGFSRLVENSGTLVLDNPMRPLSEDHELKKRQVSDILSAAHISEEVFTGWEFRERLYNIMRFGEELKAYGETMRKELEQFCNFMQDELSFLEQVSVGRRENFRRGRRLTELLLHGRRNIATFKQQVSKAIETLEFPEVRRIGKKLPFKHMDVDWYSEWLQDFNETKCVRRVHIKGEQLRPIVFNGAYEDLLVLRDGQAVCIIVREDSPEEVSPLRCLVSNTATNYNVLYAILVLSHLSEMVDEFGRILHHGRKGIHYLVSSSERLVKEIIRSEKRITVLDIERKVEQLLPHLGGTPYRDNETQQTITRTIIDLLMVGSVCPRVETVGSISPCYIETLYHHRTESRGVLLLDDTVPLGGAKLWASHGENFLSGERANSLKLVRLLKAKGNRWNMLDPGKYRPPKDRMLLASSTMRCG